MFANIVVNITRKEKGENFNFSRKLETKKIERKLQPPANYYYLQMGIIT